MALIFSNIFFFALFSNDPKPITSLTLPPGRVEIQLHGELLTPYEAQKKILLVNRNSKKIFSAILRQEPIDPTGRYTVLVKEEEAAQIFEHVSWQILPFIKTLSFASSSKGESHEIRY